MHRIARPCPASITSTSSSPTSSAASRSIAACSARSAYVREGPIVGERGEHVVYLKHTGGDGAIGLRERQSDPGVPYDRYAVGVHHVAFTAAERSVVHERAAWLTAQGVSLESGPREYDYSPGYFAVLFFDPDGIKLEIVHTPRAG